MFALFFSAAKTRDHFFIHCQFTWSLWGRQLVNLIELSQGRRLTFYNFGDYCLRARLIGSYGFFVSMLSYGALVKNGIDGFLITLQGAFLQFGNFFLISCSELV